MTTSRDENTRDRRAHPKSKVGFLEELRSIAQLGLHYARDPYDRERYERLLELAALEYATMADLPSEAIAERFRRELGHITPKVGVDAAVFDSEGRLLLVERADDGCWGLPCGWAEAGETAQEAIRREVWEETGLHVDVTAIIDVFSRMPGAFGDPHTGYFLLFLCEPTGGSLTTSRETVKVEFRDYRQVTAWHRDHRERAARAVRYRQERIATS